MRKLFLAPILFVVTCALLTSMPGCSLFEDVQFTLDRSDAPDAGSRPDAETPIDGGRDMTGGQDMQGRDDMSTEDMPQGDMLEGDMCTRPDAPASCDGPCQTDEDCAVGRVCAECVCTPVEQALGNQGGRVLWISATDPAASDDNPGSREQPWKTLESLDTASLQPGDVVILREGVYRGSISPDAVQGGTSPGLAVTFAGYPGEQAVISGSQPIDRSRWSASGVNWIYERDASSVPTAAGRQPILVDGAALEPVSSVDALTLGTYWVDDSDAPGVYRYTVRFPDGKSPDNSTLEIPVREQLFAADDDCQTMPNRGYVVLSHITFRHAANAVDQPAVTTSCIGDRLVDVVVERNSGLGLGVHGEQHQVFGLKALENGGRGISVTARDSVFENCQVSGNNIQGGGHGFFFAQESNSDEVRTCLISDNRGGGLRFYRTRGHVIDRNIIANNQGDGVTLNIPQWFEVTNNVVLENGSAGVWAFKPWGGTFAHNTIIRNQKRGLKFDTGVGTQKVANNLLAFNDAPESVQFEYRQIEGIEFTANLLFAQMGASAMADGVEASTAAAWEMLIGSTDTATLFADPKLVDSGTEGGWHLTAESPAVDTAVPLSIDLPLDIDGELRPQMNADIGADEHDAPFPESACP